MQSGLERVIRASAAGKSNGEQLLQPETMLRMRTIQPAAKDYGLGLNLSWMPKDGTAPIVRHGGAFRTMAWTDFQTGVVGVLLTQTPSAQVPEWSRLFYPALEKAGYGRMVNESPLTELGR